VREDEHSLMKRLKALAHAGDFLYPCQQEYKGMRQRVRPPVTPADLLHAETLLGFALPPLLKRIYLEVGNGGFGPGYGLEPLFTPEGQDVYFEPSIVHTTLEYRGPDYPERFLYVSTWGCNINSFIDCATPMYRIVQSGSGGWSLTLEAPSLQQWLQSWLDGEPLFTNLHGI
jgi:hypothetical protein